MSGGNDGFFDVVARRRSIRAFSPRPIPDAVLRRLVDVVRYAPSSMDGQPWEVIVVADPARRARLAEFKNRWCPPDKREYAADFLGEAPALLAVCADEERSHFRWIENGVIAATYLMLAAEALGLGTTFMTLYNPAIPGQEREAREILGLPETVRPVCLLPVGYPAGTPPEKAMRATADFLHRERFDAERDG